MTQVSSFWILWLLASLAWIWMVASDLKTGWLGWTFYRAERAKHPKAFWAFFVVQNGAALAILVWLAWAVKSSS